MGDAHEVVAQRRVVDNADGSRRMDSERAQRAQKGVGGTCTKSQCGGVG